MNAVETALYTRLTGTAGLTALLASGTAVYNIRAPQNAPLPYVVFSLVSGMDDNDTPVRDRQLLYLVKGISSVGMQQAGAIHAQIDAALHNNPLTVTGWTNFWLHSEAGDIRFVEPEQGGRNVYHAGGQYRIRLSS